LPYYVVYKIRDRSNGHECCIYFMFVFHYLRQLKEQSPPAVFLPLYCFIVLLFCTCFGNLHDDDDDLQWYSASVLSVWTNTRHYTLYSAL